MAMDYLKVLLTQRHEELEQILMNPSAVPITERASINAELKHINKALDELGGEGFGNQALDDIKPKHVVPHSSTPRR